MASDEQVGSPQGIVPELLLREVVLSGLHDIAADEYRLRELVTRIDRLYDGSHDDYAADLMRAYLRLTDPAEASYLQVLHGYPFDIAHLPCVSLIKESGVEDTSGAVHGDILHRASVQRGTTTIAKATVGRANSEATQEVPTVAEHRKIGVAYTSTVQVGSWSSAPELSLLLDAAVHQAIFANKGRLYAAGVTDVTLSDGGTPTDEQVQLNLRVGYVPIQRVTLEWIRSHTQRRYPVPNRTRIRAGTFTTEPL